MNDMSLAVDESMSKKRAHSVCSVGLVLWKCSPQVVLERCMYLGERPLPVYKHAVNSYQHTTPFQLYVPTCYLTNTLLESYRRLRLAARL